MFKYVASLLVLCCVPFALKADIRNQIGISGNWFIYGVGLYQPIERTITPKLGAQQVIKKPGFSYGLGIGKDHVRIEYTKYLDKPRFLAAFDFFPTSIATPYIGLVHGRGLRATDSSGVLKGYVVRTEGVAGITFQPIKFVNVYAEYLTRDHFFFTGIRIRLPYTVK